MWRHMLVILSNVECARIGWSDVQTPHPHHQPLNYNLTFLLDLENFLIKVWGGGGGCLAPDPPHHHP